MSRGNTFYDAQCPEFVQGNAPDASQQSGNSFVGFSNMAEFYSE